MPKPQELQVQMPYRMLLMISVIVAVGMALFAYSIVEGKWFGDSGFFSDESEPSSLRTAVAKENLVGAPSTVSLGFNNADQVVEHGAGTDIIWIENGAVIFATRDADGAVTETRVLDEGSNSLPALARAGTRVAAGWTERVGASQAIVVATWNDGGAPVLKTLGSGNGLSLAASDGQIAAVWHDGDEDSTATVVFSLFDGDEWSTPARVDGAGTGKAAVWASVDLEGSNVFVTWRDNRDGKFTVWFRRSIDGGTTWLAEQHIALSMSGDPVVCAPNAQDVWVAHHGMGKISLVHSSNGGASFGQPIDVGRGYFAHLHCRDSAIVVGWEDVIGKHTDPNKKAGYAAYSSEGSLLNSGAIEDGSVAATTVYLSPDEGSVEVIWVKTGTTPLAGTLRHQVIVFE